MANSRQFEYNDMTVVIAGKVITGISNMEVETKQEKELLYGRGNKPLSIQSGQKSFTGSMTLLQSEYNALLKAAKAINPKYDITDLAFDIIWSFLRESDGETETYTILGAEIDTAKLKLGNKDKFMEIELPFMALDVLPS